MKGGPPDDCCALDSDPPSWAQDRRSIPPGLATFREGRQQYYRVGPAQPYRFPDDHPGPHRTGETVADRHRRPGPSAPTRRTRVRAQRRGNEVVTPRRDPCSHADQSTLTPRTPRRRTRGRLRRVCERDGVTNPRAAAVRRPDTGLVRESPPGRGPSWSISISTAATSPRWRSCCATRRSTSGRSSSTAPVSSIAPRACATCRTCSASLASATSLSRAGGRTPVRTVARSRPTGASVPTRRGASTSRRRSGPASPMTRRRSCGVSWTRARSRSRSSRSVPGPTSRTRSRRIRPSRHGSPASTRWRAPSMPRETSSSRASPPTTGSSGTSPPTRPQWPRSWRRPSRSRSSRSTRPTTSPSRSTSTTSSRPITPRPAPTSPTSSSSARPGRMTDPGQQLWDELAALAVSQPGLVTWQDATLTIAPDGRLDRSPGGRPVRVATAADRTATDAALLAALRRGAPRTDPFSIAGTIATVIGWLDLLDDGVVDVRRRPPDDPVEHEREARWRAHRRRRGAASMVGAGRPAR